MLLDELHNIEQSEEGESSCNILVIEDCESDVVLLKNMLDQAANQTKLHIVTAPRLAEAFKIIKHESFDVVLLDLNLLDIQGIACVAALHAEIPDIPIIVYSGMDDPKLFKEALLCGADSYLVKGKETGDSLRAIIINAAKHHKQSAAN